VDLLGVVEMMDYLPWAGGLPDRILDPLTQIKDSWFLALLDFKEELLSRDRSSDSQLFPNSAIDPWQNLRGLSWALGNKIPGKMGGDAGRRGTSSSSLKAATISESMGGFFDVRSIP
jgi:hypothetical protein